MRSQASPSNTSRQAPPASDAYSSGDGALQRPDDSWLPEGVSADALFRELRVVAASYLSGETPGTLQPTALVNEALLRLMGSNSVDRNTLNRKDFFARACRCMSRVLVDQARRRKALKRTPPAGARPDMVTAPPEPLPVDELEHLLAKLQRISPRAAEVVRLRFFLGLSVPQTAQAMDVSVSTAESDWRFARACLSQWLGAQPPRPKVLA